MYNHKFLDNIDVPQDGTVQDISTKTTFNLHSTEMKVMNCYVKQLLIVMSCVYLLG